MERNVSKIISLVPTPLLITWNSHIDSVTDILYVDSFRLVVSASEDRDVKAWRLSGDTIGRVAADVSVPDRTHLALP